MKTITKNVKIKEVTYLCSPTGETQTSQYVSEKECQEIVNDPFDIYDFYKVTEKSEKREITLSDFHEHSELVSEENKKDFYIIKKLNVIKVNDAFEFLEDNLYNEIEGLLTTDRIESIERLETLQGITYENFMKHSTIVSED